MKNKNQYEQIIKSINVVAEFSEINPIRIMNDIVARDSNSNMTELMVNYIIDNKVDASYINIQVIHNLYANYPDKFKYYFNMCNEDSKLIIMKVLSNNTLPLLRDDFSDIDEMLKNVPDYKKSWAEKYSYRSIYVGTPMEFFRNLGQEYEVPDLTYDSNRRTKVIYETIEKYAPFYFKYIELAKLNNSRIYYDVKNQLRSDRTDTYVMKAILKRIEYYNEKKIAKSTVKSFLKIVNDPNKVSFNNRKLIIDALNEYIPTKIMIELNL